MIGDRLKQARELNNWTQDDLAVKVGVSQGAIAKMERDALQPQDDVLAQLALATSFPREFFLLPIESEFPLGSLVYRKFSRMKSEHRRKSHRLAQQAFELSEFLLKRMKPLTVGIPRGIHEPPAQAAKVTRSALGIDPVAPIKNLIHRLEKNGVRVIMLSEAVPDLDAFSLWVDGSKPIIVLNAGIPGDRQIFSTAHELGHLVLDHTGLDDVEDEADRFAGEFLLPEEAMRLELTAPVTLSSLAELKARWHVSMGALLHRARELEIVSERQNKYLRMQLSAKGWNLKEPVEIAAERPRGLRKMAEVNYGPTLSYRKIAEDTHRPPFLISRILEAHAQCLDDDDRKPTKVVDFPSNRPDRASG